MTGRGRSRGATPPDEESGRSPWARFWRVGGWWRAVLLAAIYLAWYLGLSWVIGRIFANQLHGGLFDSPLNVFVALTLPLIGGSIALALFLRSVGWSRAIFQRQPVAGRGWMWVAPVLVVVVIVLRLLGIDYGQYSTSVVALTVFSGLFIGFAEEVLCRGIVVTMLRDSGQSELSVAVLSSVVFAVLHSSNLLSGMAPLVVALTVGYTFCFGILMYLTLRVTGRLIWPILIHGLFDPTLFLSTGGVDTTAATARPSVFLVLAGPSNIVFIVAGLVMLGFVRGRALSRPSQ